MHQVAVLIPINPKFMLANKGSEKLTVIGVIPNFGQTQMVSPLLPLRQIAPCYATRWAPHPLLVVVKLAYVHPSNIQL